MVWSRVRALGVEPSEVLSASSVLGTEFAVDLLPALVDIEQQVVDDALDAAIEAGLLLPFDAATKTIRFAHALVANALYAELQPVRRRRLHERAARVLAEGEVASSQSAVVELARHSALGGLSHDAMRWSTVAGDHALAHLAPSEAASWYRAALDHCVALGRPDAERSDLGVRLGVALHRSGDPAAYATLQEAAELAQRAGASDVLVRAALATDRGFLQLGTFAPQQLAIVEAALDVADPVDISTHARLLALYAQTLIHTPRAELREEVAREALDLATASTDPTLLPAIASSVLYALWAPGSSTLRADLAARAVAAAAATGDPFVEFTTHVAAYTVAIELADPAAAARSLATLRSIAAEIGEPGMRWTVGIYDTFDATMAARLDDAERLVNANLELGMQIGEPDAFTVYASQFYALGTFAGRHAELFPIVEQLSKEAPTASPIRIALCRHLCGRRPRGHGTSDLRRDTGSWVLRHPEGHVLDDVGRRLRSSRRRTGGRRRRGGDLPRPRAVRGGGRVQRRHAARDRSPPTSASSPRFSVIMTLPTTTCRAALATAAAFGSGVPPRDHADRARAVPPAPNGRARLRRPRVPGRGRCHLHHARSS